MQEDMHFYGTYALARAAGINAKSAHTIAYAAQYVDDSTDNESEAHQDGGMFQTVATAHTNSEAIGNAAADHTEQRQVWVPFHFYPGNQGDTFSERLLCRKDSEIVREMVANHIRHALREQSYALALLGIMAHVYADTFSHYGFSGVSSRWNKVNGQSFELDVDDPKMKAYVMGKFSHFLTKYSPNFLIKNFRNIASKGAAVATGALGHGSVGTYPDRPFLRWRFDYKRDTEKRAGWRDNPATFLEGCRALHKAFNQYAKEANIEKGARSFEQIEPLIDAVLRQEKAKEGRIEAWLDLINSGELYELESGESPYYSLHHWEQQKEDFEDLETSKEMAQFDVYKFHQAAIYHRDFTLKQLLPKHGIVVL